MEERINLREFQTRLAERLKGAAERNGETAKLGFIAGGRHWLTGLDQVGEVVSVNRLARAPWTRPWFIGVAGVRGAIYGCTELAGFLGVPSAAASDEVRLLLANARFGMHAAFRIDQALGLRDTRAMTRMPPADDQAGWELARFVDGEGVAWTEIALENLLADPRFLRVTA